jgi:hypothetical protein
MTSVSKDRKTTMHFDTEEGALTPLASVGSAFVKGDVAKSVMYPRITWLRTPLWPV